MQYLCHIYDITGADVLISFSLYYRKRTSKNFNVFAWINSPSVCQKCTYRQLRLLQARKVWESDIHLIHALHGNTAEKHQFISNGKHSFRERKP